MRDNPVGFLRQRVLSCFVFRLIFLIENAQKYKTILLFHLFFSNIKRNKSIQRPIMINVLSSNKDIATVTRCNTSILPDSGDCELEIGFYWPRLFVPESSSKKKKDEKKAIKANKRRRKYSLTEAHLSENIRLSPSNSTFLHFDLSLSPSREEAVSAENRQPRHSYCWNPKSIPRIPEMKSKNMSRIVPEKPLKKLSPRKSLRSTNKTEKSKGWLVPTTMRFSGYYTIQDSFALQSLHSLYDLNNS